MLTTKSYNVLIIGAGNIGAFLDTPKSENILTHAHAFSCHKGFKLLGFVDIDMKKAQQAAARWGCTAFRDLDEAFREKTIDIVVVATPDIEHYRLLKKINARPLKLIVAEKPLTKKPQEAEEIVSLYKKINIPVVVNYTRRFIPELQAVREKVVKNYYGKFITGTSFYGKGLIHNGSHNIDLIRWFVGEINRARVLDSEIDYYRDDPSISAILTLKNKKIIYLQHISCKLFTIFENNFIFEKGMISIKNGSKLIEEYLVKENKVFKSYKNLVKTREIKTTRFRAQYFLVDNIFNFLTRNIPLKCDLVEGYKTLRASFKIREEYGKVSD